MSKSLMHGRVASRRDASSMVWAKRVAWVVAAAATLLLASPASAWNTDPSAQCTETKKTTFPPGRVLISLDQSNTMGEKISAKVTCHDCEYEVTEKKHRCKYDGHTYDNHCKYDGEWCEETTKYCDKKCCGNYAYDRCCNTCSWSSSNCRCKRWNTTCASWGRRCDRWGCIDWDYYCYRYCDWSWWGYCFDWDYRCYSYCDRYGCKDYDRYCRYRRRTSCANRAECHSGCSSYHCGTHRCNRRCTRYYTCGRYACGTKDEKRSDSHDDTCNSSCRTESQCANRAADHYSDKRECGSYGGSNVTSSNQYEKNTGNFSDDFSCPSCKNGGDSTCHDEADDRVHKTRYRLDSWEHYFNGDQHTGSFTCSSCVDGEDSQNESRCATETDNRMTYNDYRIDSTTHDAYQCQGFKTKWEIAKDAIDSITADLTVNEDPDIVEFGLSLFHNNNGDTKVDPQPDANPPIMSALNNHSPSGSNGDVAGIHESEQKLKNTRRGEAGVYIADGKLSSDNDRTDAINAACSHRSAADLHVIGFDAKSDMQFNHALAAAGGTGQCCPEGFPDCKPGGSQMTIGESGTSDTLHDDHWNHVNLDGSLYDSTPAVFATTVTERGGQDPSAAQVANVSQSGFDTHHCEPDGNGYCDTHNPEDNAWLAVDIDKARKIDGVDAGTFTMPSGTEQSKEISLSSDISNKPYVFTDIQWSSKPRYGVAVKTTFRDHDRIRIEACRQTSRDGCGNWGGGKVAWLAIDPAQADGQINGVEWGHEHVDNSGWEYIDYNGTTFDNTPAVLTDVQTEDDGGGTDSLEYGWYVTQEYYNTHGHPPTKSEFDEFFDTSNSGVGQGRWHDGFEDGDDDDDGWNQRFYDWRASSWRSYGGNYSAYVYDYSVPHYIAEIHPNPIRGGVKADRFRFYYYEYSNSNGGGVRLRDSSNREILKAGTNNPQWDVWGRNRYRIGGNRYYDWHRVTVDFDWSSDRAHVEFRNMDRNRSSSQWVDFSDSRASNLEEIEVINVGGDNMVMWYDDFQVEWPGSGNGTHSDRIHWHNGGQWDSKPSYLPADGYSWKVEGWIKLPEDGSYRFGVDGDDAIDVYVDGKRVADWYGGHGDSYYHTNGSHTFTKGWKPFRARMEEGGGGDAISVAWERPGRSGWDIVPQRYFSKTGPEEALFGEALDVGRSSARVRYCESEENNSCDSHGTEEVAWMAIEPGKITAGKPGTVDICQLSDAELKAADNGRSLECEGAYEARSRGGLKSALSTITDSLACTVDVSDMAGGTKPWTDPYQGCQDDFDCLAVRLVKKRNGSVVSKKRVLHPNSGLSGDTGWTWESNARQDKIVLDSKWCNKLEKDEYQLAEVTLACMCEETGGESCTVQNPPASTCDCGVGSWTCHEGSDICQPNSDASCPQPLEGEGQSCSKAVGVCKTNGQTQCDSDDNLYCDAEPVDPPEDPEVSCDGKDNDCDGTVDETDAMPDEICDGEDNDCDGKVDEDLGGSSCNSGNQGRCSAGVSTCVAPGETSDVNGQVIKEGEKGYKMMCEQNLHPMPEVCNGLDDDCDGQIDNLRDSWGSDELYHKIPDSPPEGRSEAVCMESQDRECVCSSDSRSHRGTGEPDEYDTGDEILDEFEHYLDEWEEVQSNKCHCAGG